MPLSPYQANKFLQSINGKSDNLYLGLATGKPVIDAEYPDTRFSNTYEISGNGYARAAITNATMTAAAYDSSGKSYTENEAVIYFPVVTGSDWDTCTYILLCNSATPAADGSDIIAYGAISNVNFAPEVNQVPLLPVGTFVMSMAVT